MQNKKEIVELYLLAIKKTKWWKTVIEICFSTLQNNDHGHSHADNENHEHSHEDHHDHSDKDHNDHSDEHLGYPYAMLAVCAGFFIISFVEAVVHHCFGGDHGSTTGSHGHSHAIPPGMLQNKGNDNKENNEVDNDSGASDPERYAM